MWEGKIYVPLRSHTGQVIMDVRPFPGAIDMRYVPSLVLVATLVLVSACANTGSPSGGPKDETPPRLIRTEPAEYQIDYAKKRIVLHFNELVSLERSSEKVIVSPPQVIPADIKAVGDKISVVFKDTLRDSTTYTIDFTDAIVDFNEKNPFGDYAFSFSTGSHIDTLRIGGTLIDASNLNPIPGIIVGVHEDTADSVFANQPLTRISKTSKTGSFSIKGLPGKSFRLYALGDKNRDYRFDQPGEAIAFHDSLITPWAEPCIKPDTIWKDTATIDTIFYRQVTCYKPDDVVLLYFSEAFGRQYLAKRERPAKEYFNLTFGYKADSLPTLSLLNKPVGVTEWFLPEVNPTKDTLRFWITDTLVANMDTLTIKLDYLKTDSTNNLAPQTDTINLVFRHPRTGGRSSSRTSSSRKKEEAAPPQPTVVKHLEVTLGLPAVLDVNASPLITLETPLQAMPKEAWGLFHKVDTTWQAVPFSLHPDSTSIRRYVLKAAWAYETEYKLTLDSGLVVGLYGATNDDMSRTFKTRAEGDYSRLIVTVKGLQGAGFVELLNKSDKVVRRASIVNGIADFRYLRPGSYYTRAVADWNNNGQWDPGLYSDKRQPEPVYYNPKQLNLRAHWDVEEVWDVTELPLLEQKPQELQKAGEQRSR